jgi:hypothetical protein
METLLKMNRFKGSFTSCKKKSRFQFCLDGMRCLELNAILSCQYNAMECILVEKNLNDFLVFVKFPSRKKIISEPFSLHEPLPERNRLNYRNRG